MRRAVKGVRADTERQTLELYADRRHALGGRALLQHFNPYLLPIDDLKRACEANGQAFLNFAEYDYLSLGKDERVLEAAKRAIDVFGIGAGASRLVGGERSVHSELEAKLASFVGTQDALALVSGYGTNVGLVSHLLTTNDLIVVDEYSHNSIMVGARLSRAETRIFAHNDLADLATILEEERGRFQRVLVITEGLYSMEGDIPDLPLLLDICERHDAWLLIDEAHSIGVLGATGRGITEHFGIDPNRIDLIVGTLSKAFAACGGFVCGKASVIDWLRYSLNGFIYSVGLPPHIACAVQTAVSVLEAEPERVEQLTRLSQHFVAEAGRNGFDVGTAIGAGVVPIMFDDPVATLMASKALLTEGIYVPPVVQIGVPKDKPRLRFFLTTAHTEADLGRVFGVLCDWRQAYPAVRARHGSTIAAIEHAHAHLAAAGE